MAIIITILTILVCAVLGFFILIQNPKGGGLTGSFGTLGTQVMGVKQSGDVMEKGTWILMGTVGALCLISVAFLPKTNFGTEEKQGNGKAQQQKTAPAPDKKGGK